MIEALESMLRKARWEWEHAACCGDFKKMDEAWEVVKELESQIASVKGTVEV